MLRNTYAQDLKDDLQYLKNNKDELSRNPDSLNAFRLIIELIKTNGWRLKKPRDFDSNMDSFIKKYGAKFRAKEAKEELLKLVGNRKRKNIEQLLTNYSSIKQFTEDLYRLAVQGKTVVLGEKGRDNYLRDFGYWDRIPIDRHEMRFIIRTGIYHACSTKDKSDHLEKRDLQHTLTLFCSQFLKHFVVEGIDLGSAPGIVDLFIWSFSAEDRYNICGAHPRCDQCTLRNACLYALTNQSLVCNST